MPVITRTSHSTNVLLILSFSELYDLPAITMSAFFSTCALNDIDRQSAMQLLRVLTAKWT